MAADTKHAVNRAQMNQHQLPSPLTHTLTHQIKLLRHEACGHPRHFTRRHCQTMFAWRSSSKRPILTGSHYDGRETFIQFNEMMRLVCTLDLWSLAQAMPTPDLCSPSHAMLH